jgi:uncharacterized protein (TIGR03435 family)
MQTRATHAQTGGEARPAFEVASVKPHAGDEGPRGISFSPSGRFTWNRMTLQQLMQSAYAEIAFKQIAGGAAWTTRETFDIAAMSSDALADIGPGGVPRGLFRRLRTLLEDRFALRTRVEMRPLSVYVLQPVAIPMVNGPELKDAGVDCGTETRETVTGRQPQRPYGEQPPCSLQVNPGRITGRALSMAQLISALEPPAGRPVIDRTGLTRTYDVQVRWAFEFPPGATLNGQPAPAATDGPSIFTAVREQLGLKLEATRADVPVLVIDTASRPTPD